MKKSIIALLAATIITLAFLAPTFLVGSAVADVEATDAFSADYALVNGVLSTDKYALYPYSTARSLKIGFSKYGEMVNNEYNVGLEYGAVDPFAAPAGSAVGSIPKVLWIQGWLINITYYNIPASKYRNVWAYAAFSDANVYGGSWIRVDFNGDWSATYGWEDPRDPGYIIGNYAAGGSNFGGRKTNGTAVTLPIQVLYNGPRLFAAKLNTTIYDHPPYLDDTNSATATAVNGDIPLVQVVFTILFNKVKKEVIILKDVKSLLTEKTGVQMLIQFSNRGEVDLGTEAAGYHSRFHFFTQGTGPQDSSVEGQPTVYNSDWTMCKTKSPDGFTAAGPYPQNSDATYDVAQAINAGYVWWAAFWPSLSDWTIDGWGIHWRSMRAADDHWIDGDPAKGGEPRIPFYIGEWDFYLWAKEYYDPEDPTRSPIQFRGVTVYGVTDLNDGSDTAKSIDTEVKYQLNEIFNPWDLNDAVHKGTQRWVEYHTGSTIWYSSHKPVIVVSNTEWDDYCVFSERVEDLTTGTVLKRGVHYSMSPYGNGKARITGLTSSHLYKILYSTATEYGYDGEMDIGVEPWEDLPGTDSEDNTILNDYFEATVSFEDWLGAEHTIELWGNILITNSTNILGNHTWTYSADFNPYVYDVKVFKEDTALLGVDDIEFAPENVTDNEQEGNVTEFSLSNIGLEWYASGPDLLDLHIDYLDAVITFIVNLEYNATANEYTAELTVTFKPYEENDYLYLEHIPGRYEWGVVGRDAYSVDSAGLSLVSAAFKNKQVEYGLAGADMYDSLVAAQMPWVMRKFGTGHTWADYYYSGTDYRTALKDDWCRPGTVTGDEVPISSSNMIGVGGCLANFLAYYGNDFMAAFFALSYAEKYGDFTDYSPWERKIIPLTCWDITKTRAYSSSNAVGYAVISTYKDINGTVLFLIWGHWGRDTYYVTKWFHEEGIYQLQSAPAGLTAIIVEIDYESTSEGYKPTDVSIVECLGTISETLWVHGREYKGGIHDP